MAATFGTHELDRSVRRSCIINVDDFGASQGINRGVWDAHRAGVVTSASLMVNAAAVDEALSIAGREQRLSVGLHVNFTNEGGPPIVDLDDGPACAAELHRQLELFVEMLGRPPTHLDSHHHVHRRPRIEPAFVEAAETLGIALRDHPPVRFVGSFYGSWDGESHPEQVSMESLGRILAGLDEGVSEIATHAGYVDASFESEYHDERELELTTLLDPRLPTLLDELGIDLIGFADVEVGR